MASVPKLLLLVLCSYHTLAAHVRGDGNYTVLSIGSLKSDNHVCSEPEATSQSTGVTTVPLHHRHGPCSPLPSKKMPTLEEILGRDQLRAAYIQRKFSGGDAKQGGVQLLDLDVTVPTTLGMSLDTLEYVITVGIGSPDMIQTMFIDTGSDVSWVQCEPCSQCHSQADPLFDPSLSSTYSPIPCISDTCAELGQEGSGCWRSQCQYIVRYGDGSSTTGTYGSDTLVLGPNIVTNFQFGCNYVDSGFSDQTAGLMGIGGGPQSLVSQTAGTLGAAFSYCLPPTPSSSGFLTLGAVPGGQGFVMTPMLRSSPVPTFYGVTLEAIVVGGRQLFIPPWVFSAGAIMDSGTVITRLPWTAYSALSTAFRAAMRRYPPAPPSSILDTCFDFSGQRMVVIPTVALVFSGGAVVNLDANGIILDNCLAFAGNSDDWSLGIIGNVQQRTFEVLYDVGGGAVGFRAGAC
ncbi:unnamed protein product [Urochloa decumbens]|uniref:Peptidase A1 domain-containing protein n=1 Tax=Urochloa decumbens TaxID=240449 RepID=A0ABC9EDL6_9POAL